MYPTDTAQVFRRHTVARLGGSGADTINAIKAGPNGEVYVVGSTTSGDFPVKNAAQPESAEASAMRSIDLGRTWTRFNPPPASADPRFPEPTLLRAHPSVAGLLFAAVGPILWRSSDAGQTWQLVYTAEPGEESASGFIAAIGFDQRATTTVYLFSTDGFSTSGDAGMTWQTKPPVSHPSRIGVGPDQASQTKIDSDPRGSGALITRPDGNAILSRDGGGTWTTLRPPIDQTGSVATFSGARDGQIYAGVSAGASGSLWVSNDWGATWSLTKAQPNSAVVDLFTDPDAPNTLYVVTLGALRISDDGGQSWRNEPTFDFLSYQVTRVTGCSTSTALVTIRAANQLAISENRGDTWQNTHLRDVQRFTAGSGCSIYVLRAISGDAFVAKLDRSGAIEWSTYLGDLGSERLNAVTHDRAGNVIAVGGGDPFGDSLVAKYAPDGRLLWKKTVGGRYPDTLLDVVADQSGNIILGGRTTSDDLPVTPGAARREPGTGFAVKLKPDGEIVWATYLDAPASSLAVEPDNAILIATWSSLLRLSPGGDSITPLNTIVRQPQIVRTDAAGNVFLTGIVPPAETPVTPGAYVSPIRARPCSQVSWGPPYSESTNDLQVARLRAGTLEPDFSALLGGECGTHADSLDIAPDGRVTVGFVTQSQAFDLRAPLASAGFCRGYDLGTGIAQLTADGARLLRSTMLDGCFSVKVAHVDSEIWAASDQSEDALLLRVPDTVVPGPRIDRIFNAFSGAGFGVSPGSLMTLRGVELGPVDGIDLGLRPANVLPTELGGTQVLFNRIPVHIISVSANQVTFTAPYRLEGTSAALQVKRGEQSSKELLVPVVEANPGILAADYPSPDPESRPVAIARKQDGTLITPSNPAPAGSTVWIYATGLGATNIEVPSGAIATTEALRPAADFREAAGLPSTYGPFPTPLDPSGARAMIGFVNSVFAVPIVVRESGEPNGRTLIRITPAIQTRGASRRSYSPATILYVCKTTQTGSCQAQQ